MDAIALSMFVEPAVVPGPSTETPQSGTPFGELVAAAATSKQQDVDDTTDTPSDMAASQAGLMSAIVSQWLVQRDNSPSLPTFASGILEERPSDSPDAAASPDTADEPALPIDGLPLSDEGDQSADAAEHTVESGGTHRGMPERSLAPDSTSRDEGSTPVSPQAHGEERRVSIQELVQYAADIGWRVPAALANRASADVTTVASSEAIEATAAKLEAPVPVTRANAASNQKALASPADDQAKSVAAPNEAPIRDEGAEPDSTQPKATTAADHFHASEHTRGASMRSPESLPQPSANAPTSTASPAFDTISAPSTGNISAAAESSADMPVKLAVAAREGQTAEMQTLALHIAARWAKGDSRFTIRLDPPELGRIDVNLNVNSHGHAQAVLTVEKPQTLDLLLRDAPTLERALKDAGLELGGNLSFSLKEDARQNFAQDDHYSPRSGTVEVVPTDAAKSHVALNASLVERLYGSRMARLDITV